MRADAADGFAAVRAEVETACQSLIVASPEALISSERAFRRAITVLRDGRAAWDWNSSGNAARSEVAKLQATIRRASGLLSSASNYHAGWLRILSAMSGGYSPQGQAVPMPGVRRISLEG